MAQIYSRIVDDAEQRENKKAIKRDEGAGDRKTDCA